jgi:hypothetical protein
MLPPSLVRPFRPRVAAASLFRFSFNSQYRWTEEPGRYQNAVRDNWM